jgi:ABC-type nitrate/sulfonate/bicarbonate transport system substrate-binding protein
MLDSSPATSKGLETAPQLHRGLGDASASAAGSASLSWILSLGDLQAVRADGCLGAIRARAQGTQTRLVSLSWLNEFQALIATPGSGIRRVRSLRDRKIGRTARGAGADEAHVAALRGITAALDINGLSHRHVEWVELTSGAEASALADGTVDAVYVTGLRGVELVRAAGASIVFSAGDHPDPWVRTNTAILSALTVDEGLLRSRPDLLERDLGVLHDASRQAQSNPQAFLAQLVVKHQLPERDVRLAYGADAHRRLSPELGEDHIKIVEEFKRFLLRWGFVWTDFDARSWAAWSVAAAAGNHR